MVTALVAACAAVLGIVVTLVATRLARARASRRVVPVHARIDEHLRAISETLDRVAALATTRPRQSDEPDLNLDLGTLLEQLVAEAAASTGAQAVAARVEGPGGAPVVASFGASDGAGLLETALGPPDARPFRALTINWTYGPAMEDEEGAYTSALVVPVVEEGTATGALVAYAGPGATFESEHLRALRALADDAAPGIASARRFAEVGQRSLTDELTGIRNRSGYELELEREVARAHRTGRPLSLILVELHAGVAALPEEEIERAVREFADLLRRTARTTDIPCRRRAREFAVVLPETRDEGARRFFSRLREETGGTFGPGGQRTFSVGLVEWRPNETSDALDARAAAAVTRSDAAELRVAEAAATAIELRGSRRRTAGADAEVTGADPRGRLLERLELELHEAGRLGHPVSVVALEVDEIEDDEAADALRAHVAARIEDCVDVGATVSRFAPNRFMIVIPRASAADAQSTLSVLQASLEVQPPEHAGRLTVSAGIGELSPPEDASGLLRRAEGALGRARRAGGGAVVVAPGGDTRP